MRTLASSFAAVLLALAFSSSASAGVLVVANKSDDTVDLIDLGDGTSKATLPTGGAPHEVAVSPDGRIAVVANYGTRESAGSSLTVLDLAAAKVARTIDLGRHTRPHGLAWLPGGRIAVTAEGSRHLLVIDPDQGTILREIATEQDVSHMVAVTPDGRRAFVANIGSGSVTALDLEAGRKIADIKTGAGAEGIATAPGGKHVWVTNRDADTLSVVRTDDLAVERTIPCPGFPIRVALTPDGKSVLVSCARSGEVVVFDAESGQERLRRKLDLTALPESTKRLFGDRFGTSPVPVGLVVAPDGKRAWVAATQADAVVAVDPATLDVLGVVRAGREPDGMALATTAPASKAE